MEGSVSNYDLKLFTDAAGSNGYGTFLGGRWSAEHWLAEWRVLGFLKNLVLLKLFLVVVALSLWVELFSTKKARLHCDNLAVVQVMNSLSGSSPQVIH